MVSRRGWAGLGCGCVCVGAWVGALAGCAGGAGALSGAVAGLDGRGPARAVVLDGRLDEWPAGVSMLVDGQYLYLRLTPPELATLQANGRGESVVLLVDVDGDPGTGRRDVGGRGAGGDGVDVGTDVVVVFSPGGRFPELGERRQGVEVGVYGADGSLSPISHADIDLSFAPTYAAAEYEVRMSRPLLARVTGAGPRGGVGADMRVRAEVRRGSRGRIPLVEVAASGFPPADPEPELADVVLPRRGDGELRVVSWNVLRSAPLQKPEGFARVLRSLAPDVVLLQEWDKSTPEEIAAWLDEHVPGAQRWRVMGSAGWGVAIASRLSLERLGPERLEHPEPSGPSSPGRDNDRATRFVGATVSTAWGPVAVASVHLKCCGSMGSPEDVTRLAEASQINAVYLDAVSGGSGGASGGALYRVIGGDINLVGSRPPLEVLGRGLDADGSDLMPVDAPVAGDAAYFTWRDAPSAFSPGRLDWVTISDATLEVRRAFVLDACRLADGVLARAGLERGDTLGSDHLPVVVDLAPRP